MSGMVSEELFRRQLEVTEKLAQTVGDNAATTRQVAVTQKESIDLLREVHEETRRGRDAAVVKVETHITKETDRVITHVNQTVDAATDKLVFLKRPEWWLAIAILAGAAASGSILKVAGLIK